MVRPTPPRQPAPAAVRAAVTAFRTEMSAAVVRFFILNPGAKQADAVDELGHQSNISRAIADLVQQGVLIEAPTDDGRSRSYTADVPHVRRMLSELTAYVLGQESPDA